MLFPCTPYEVVQFTVEKLSFSGKYGLTIDELWKFIQASFKQEQELDDFQKQTIWQWLFFENDDNEAHEPKLYVTYNGEAIPIDLNYNAFIGNYSDRENVRVLPQYEVQAYYLTGVSNNKMFFKSLGEKPYELLQEIAKHGANGIWSPDLVDATGQDNRSLTSRLKKLEDYKLIIKEGKFYSKRKVHSNLIIHIKFAGSIGDSIEDASQEQKPKKKPASKETSGDANDNENENENENEDDEEEGGSIFYWRSRDKLRNHIIDACKNAPHQVRVFRDLKRELRLHKSRARAHLFTAVTNVLHNAGIIEKVNIRDKDSDRLIYALKFIRDPQEEFVDNGDSDFTEVNPLNEEKGADEDDDDEDDDDENEENKGFPLYNNLFPLSILTAYEIDNSNDKGTTIKAIIQSLCGENRHRMIERFFDFLPSYQLKGDTLEHLSPYPDEDETSGVMRTFEAEGKVKYYNFFFRSNYPQELKLKPAKKKSPALKVYHEVDFKSINKQYFSKIQERGKGSLVTVPKRLGSANILLHPERGEKLPEVEDEPEVKEDTPKPKRTRKATIKREPKEPKTIKAPKEAKEPKVRLSKKRKLDNELKDLDYPKGNDIISQLKRAARRPPIVIEDIDDDKEDDKDDDYHEEEPVKEVENDKMDFENSKEDKPDEDLVIIDISVPNTGESTEEEKKHDKETTDVVKEEAADENSTTVGETTFNGDTSFNANLSFNGDSTIYGEGKIFIAKKEKVKSSRRKIPIVQDRLFADSKGELRRNLILKITKSKGGVAYSSSEFLRELDVLLGNTTTRTDRKTLSRDLSRLQATGELEVEEVPTRMSGQDVTRTLFMITEEEFRPTQEQIDIAREESKVDLSLPGSKAQTSLRTVDSDYTLFKIETPFVRKRLESLSTATSRRTTASKRGQRPRKLLQKSIEEEEQQDEHEGEEEEGAIIKKTRHKSEEKIVKLKKERKGEVATIVRKKLKRKSAPEKRSGRGPSANGKKAVALKFDKEDSTTLFRAVCISKAFVRNMIDFESIREIFNNADIESLRKSWSTLRRSVGGAQVINRGVKEFERIVMMAIEDEVVEASDLENLKFPFFLDLWSKYEAAHEEILDTMPLYKNKKDNERYYEKNFVNLFTIEPFDVYELPSMIMKEIHLASTPFFEAQDDDDALENDLKVFPHKEHEDIRTILKAIFGTSKQKSNSNQIDKLLSDYSSSDIHSASEGMIRDKELIYFGTDDSQDNFQLTDKVYAPLNVRVDSSFFNKAAQFKQNLIHVINSNKGFILSQGVSNGHVAEVLQLVSDGSVCLSRIDKNYDFEGYESRLLNKGNLDCEIVLYKPETIPAIDEEDTKMTSPVPTGKACSRIWLDINGQIDSKLWIDILVALLYHIHFRPGTTLELIFNKFDSLLSAEDFNSVIGWLVQNEFINKGPLGGYYSSSNWLSVLGS